MFRPKTVSAHCAETSVSAIVEVRSECAETSISAIVCRIIRPDLNYLYYLRITCVACHSIASNL